MAVSVYKYRLEYRYIVVEYRGLGRTGPTRADVPPLSSRTDTQDL